MRTAKHRAERPRAATKRPAPMVWGQERAEMLPGGALRFTVPVLESANRIWRNQRGRTHIDADYKSAKRAAALRFRHVPKLAGPLEVRITWYRDKAQGDADNRIKPALDLLKGIAYADDATVCAIQMLRVDDRTQAARLEIVVRPYTTEMAA